MHSLNSTLQPNMTIQFKCAIGFNCEAPRSAVRNGAKRQERRLVRSCCGIGLNRESSN